MNSPIPAAIGESAAAFARATTAVRADQLGSRTPCEKFTLAELLAHMGQVLPSSERAARKEPQPSAVPADSADDPVAVGEAARRVAVAWGDPAAYDGTTEFGPGAMPAGLAAVITLQELALHGWDLARAAGQPFDLGETTGLAVLEAVRQLAGNARVNGSYGPPVAVPADAPAFQRALAESGRDPNWQG